MVTFISDWISLQQEYDVKNKIPQIQSISGNFAKDANFFIREILVYIPLIYMKHLVHPYSTG